MSSPAAEVNVTFAATDCTDLNGIFLHRLLQGGPGTLPEVAGRDDPLPGADGMFVRNRRIRRRTIALSGFVRGVATSETTDRDDYWTNRSALETLFDPTVTGTLRVDTGAAAYTIAARPMTIEINEVLPSFAYAVVTLESVVPDWTEGT